MTIAAARGAHQRDVLLRRHRGCQCRCNVARLSHAPDITLIYESGTIATKPDVLPLSIGDGELCEDRLVTVSVPEMFRYWLQARRINKGFLSAASSTVSPYQHHGNRLLRQAKVKLPAPAARRRSPPSCGEILIVMAQSKRSFVEKLDFVTSLGHGKAAMTASATESPPRAPPRSSPISASWSPIP